MRLSSATIAVIPTSIGGFMAESYIVYIDESGGASALFEKKSRPRAPGSRPNGAAVQRTTKSSPAIACHLGLSAKSRRKSMKIKSRQSRRAAAYLTEQEF